MLNFFDPSFKQFSAPSLIKLYYGLSVGLVAIAWLLLLLAAFDASFFAVLLVLVMGPVVAFFLLIGTRIACEWILATVQAAENTAVLVELMGRTSGPPAAAGTVGHPVQRFISAPPLPPTQ